MTNRDTRDWSKLTCLESGFYARKRGDSWRVISIYFLVIGIEQVLYSRIGFHLISKLKTAANINQSILIQNHAKWDKASIIARIFHRAIDNGFSIDLRTAIIKLISNVN